MKAIRYIVVFCLFLSGTVFAQEKGNTEVFTTVEQQPEFPGGMQALMNFIKSNLKYPTICKELGFSGKVFLKFIVDTSGTVNSAEVLKSSGNDLLDLEALRVVKLMPKWKPGMQNGRAVMVYFNLPIAFRLQGDVEILKLNDQNLNEHYQAAIGKIKSGKISGLELDLAKISGDPDAILLLALLAYDRDFEESKKLMESITTNKNYANTYSYQKAKKYLTEIYYN